MLDGGDGNDVLTGGGVLIGGAGNDTFKNSAAGLNGDTITDFSRGDRIVITDASLAGFGFSLSGSQLSFTGGSMTLSNLRFASIAASAAPEGGVQITFSGPPIVLSAGASVSPAIVSQATAQSAQAIGMAPTNQFLDQSDFRGDRPGGWLAGFDGSHWEATHMPQDDLFALA